jgi:hypothetical protein
MGIFDATSFLLVLVLLLVIENKSRIENENEDEDDFVLSIASAVTRASLLRHRFFATLR